MEAQEPPWQGRNWVLFVVNVRHMSAEVAVDPVGEVLVPDARHAIADHAYGNVGAEVQAEVDTVEERESRSERVPDDGDG